MKEKIIVSLISLLAIFFLITLSVGILYLMGLIFKEQNLNEYIKDAIYLTFITYGFFCLFKTLYDAVKEIRKEGE